MSIMSIKINLKRRLHTVEKVVSIEHHDLPVKSPISFKILNTLDFLNEDNRIQKIILNSTLV